ncbi:uncharacterized protein [Venturia canescens]|uniref:uncharacterized protein n=1 Tax=Venturia canescens TaxID=32260 RepID=UPI001C9C8EB8|nr:uncharacterized protein LOC122406871 [Venturia canescens]
MKLVCSLLFLAGITHLASGIGERDPAFPYCFHFTWIGYLGPDNPEAANCTTFQSRPCNTPFVITTDGTPPNTTYMWYNENQTAISCPLENGFTCIKYTYAFNDAVQTISYFCGKMIEDNTTAVTSGCFSQVANAYTTEVCACTNTRGIPCNSSIKTRHSMKMLIILTLISMFSCNI